MASRQGQQLQRLLEQLLAAAALDRGQARLARWSLVDAATLATEAGHAARLAHPDHPIAIAVAGPLPVRVDPLAISRILGNLLDNAATHTPPGTPIRLSASRDARHAMLVVQDAGAWDPTRPARPGLRALHARRPADRQRRQRAWAWPVHRQTAGPRQPRPAAPHRPARRPGCPLRAAPPLGRSPIHQTRTVRRWTPWARLVDVGMADVGGLRCVRGDADRQVN